MNEMIERVAKAIETELEAAQAWGTAPLQRDLARAAIEAMREPTQDMVRASGPDPHGGGHTARDAEDIYTSMIDAAMGRGK